MIAGRSRFIGYLVFAVASFGGCQLVSGVDNVEYEDDGAGAGTTAAETTAAAATSTAAAGMGGAGGSTTSQSTTTATMAQSTSTGSTTSPCNNDNNCDENETKCLCPIDCLNDLSCQNGCCDPSVDTSECVGRDADCQAVPTCTANAGTGQDCHTESMNCGNCTSCRCPENQHCELVQDLGYTDCVNN